MSSGVTDSGKRDNIGDNRSTSTHPFSTQTKHRSFKIIVDGHNYYVNPHLLADFSPFFDVLCFGDFEEAKQGTAEIADMSSDDWETFLFVMGADTKKPCVEIDESNCAFCLRLSARFDVPVLRTRCLEYLENDFCEIQPDIRNTIRIVLVCEDLSVGGLAMENVVSRLAGHGIDELIDNNVHHLVKSGNLIAAIFGSASKKVNDGKGHVPSTGVVSSCFLKNCDKEGVECSHCKFHLCPDHMKLPCFNTAARGSGKVKWHPDMEVLLSFVDHVDVSLVDYN